MVTVDERAVTLITGGASGMGRATAERLARRGDHVVLGDLDEQGLAETARLIRAAGGQVDTAVVDVRERPMVERWCADAVERLGGITYLFSHAGPRITSSEPVSALALADWNAMVETNVTGAFHLCQAVLPQMVARRAGAIVLTASDYSIIGMRNAAHYAAAKTALYSLAKALAVEFAPHGIRVNAIGPGPIDTPHLRRGRTGSEWDEAARASLARIPMGRLGRPEEVASVVEFLLSDRAAYITGQMIQPNGGQVMW